MALVALVEMLVVVVHGIGGGVMVVEVVVAVDLVMWLWGAGVPIFSRVDHSWLWWCWWSLSSAALIWRGEGRV